MDNDTRAHRMFLSYDQREAIEERLSGSLLEGLSCRILGVMGLRIKKKEVPDRTCGPCSSHIPVPRLRLRDHGLGVDSDQPSRHSNHIYHHYFPSGPPALHILSLSPPMSSTLSLFYISELIIDGSLRALRL